MAGGNVSGALGPLFVAAGNQYHIPPEVLAGVASVETNLGGNRSTSSAGAQGLMQFMPATAASNGVNPYDDRSAIFGAARLLNAYGYQKNALRAIGAYNGGPGNPQMGYANQVMSEAARLKGQLAQYGASGAIKSMAQQHASGPTSPGTTTVTTPGGVDYNSAIIDSLLGGSSKIDTSGKVSAGGGLLSRIMGAVASGKYTTPSTTTTTPNAAPTSSATTKIAQQQAGANTAYAHGWVPTNAKFELHRQDHGRDIVTVPGGAITAPGAGYVVSIGSDPGGFGPRYPVIHFTSGPYAGRTMFIGHTLAAVTAGQHFTAGATLSHTGWGVGSATVPGWAEIGYGIPGGAGYAYGQAPF